MMSTVITKYEELASFMTGDNICESSANSTKRTEGHREYFSMKYVNLDFPQFDGDDR